MIKLSTKMTSDIIELRKKCFAEYNYEGFDGVDYRTKEILHLKYEVDGKLLGAGRIVFGPAIPASFIYKIDDLQIRDFEVGRLCIDASIKSPMQKFKIISELVKKTIAICLLTKCNRLFTGSTGCNSFIYKNLVGFYQIADPEAYPPCKEKKIYLLALDFTKEYTQRKRGVFEIKNEELQKTKEQLIEIGYSLWL